jgi:hypothetical protein
LESSEGNQKCYVLARAQPDRPHPAIPASAAVGVVALPVVVRLFPDWFNRAYARNLLVTLRSAGRCVVVEHRVAG